MRLRWSFALLVAACTPRPETSGAPSVTVEDPPVHLHPHPDIAPDELGDAPPAAPVTEDAGACPPRETPPGSAPPVHIASGPPVTNYIPPQVIMRPVRERAACLRSCYDAGLARRPTLEGRIVLKFVVDSDGWVRVVRVLESELDDRDVEACIRGELVGLHYPPPTGGASISVVYPIEFRRP